MVEGAERAAERLRVLADAMRAFAEATTELDQLLDLVAKRLAEVLGDSCVLMLLDEAEQLLVPAAAHSVDKDALERAHRLVKSDPFTLATHPAAKHVLDTRSAIVVPRVDPSTFHGRTASAYVAYQAEQGVHSLLAVALHVHGRALGLLTMTRHRASSPPFTEDDRDLAQSLADHASLAISNARLYLAERRARLAAEEAMRSRIEAEARFGHLYHSGIIGIVVGQLDGKISDVNPYVERMLGYSREDIVSGRVSWNELTPPGWTDVDATARAQIAGTGVGALREKEYLRADGTSVPVLLGSAKVADGPEILSFILDLTERKQVETTLERLRAERALDARFRAVVEAAPDAIVVTDGNGRVTIANGQAERLFGYDREELLGGSFERLVPGQASADLVGVRKGGSEFPLEMTTSTLAVDDSGFVIVRAIRDLSERKAAELALVEAKDSAEAANRELEAFSYSVAHDLRTPLRSVNGYAQILLDENAAQLDDSGREHLFKITRSAKRMGALIDGLLGLARLTRVQLNRGVVDLSALMRAALANALAEAGTSHPRARVLIEEGLRVEADPTLMRALVDNLAGNAVKFTSRTAAPRIELGAETLGDERVFFLRDNGAGFDMAFAGKLFAPFERLHSAREFAGTGVGLATVQRIVQRHGGRIWAEGRVDDGATFYFTVPTDD